MLRVIFSFFILLAIAAPVLIFLLGALVVHTVKGALSPNPARENAPA